MLSWFGHNSKCWIKVLSWNTIYVSVIHNGLCCRNRNCQFEFVTKKTKISIFTTAARLYSQMNIKCRIIQLEIQPNILRDIPLLYSTKPSPSVNTLAECRTKKRRDTLSFKFWVLRLLTGTDFQPKISRYTDTDFQPKTQVWSFEIYLLYFQKLCFAAKEFTTALESKVKFKFYIFRKQIWLAPISVLLGSQLANLLNTR